MVKITKELKDVLSNRIQKRYQEKVTEIAKEIEQKAKVEIVKIKELDKKVEDISDKRRELEYAERKLEDNKRDLIRNLSNKFSESKSSWGGGISFCSEGVQINNASNLIPSLKSKLFDVNEQFLLALEEISMSEDKEGVIKKILDKINGL